MTDDEKCAAIARYTELVAVHVEKTALNTWASDEEYQEALEAVLEEKAALMAAL